MNRESITDIIYLMGEKKKNYKKDNNKTMKTKNQNSLKFFLWGSIDFQIRICVHFKLA